MAVYPPLQTAADLYAVSQGKRNEGDRLCHFCGSVCTNKWKHDEPPPVPYIRHSKLARHPINPYVCQGCFLWNRPRFTITSLGGEQKDSQSPKKHSWLITETDARFINYEDRGQLWKVLLRPPLRFALMLLDKPNIDNHLQFGVLNNFGKIEGDTKLCFSVDTVVYEYSVYDLEMALTFIEAARPKGILTLMNLLQPYPTLPPPKVDEQKRKVGRPKHGEEPDKEPPCDPTLGPKKLINS